MQTEPKKDGPAHPLAELLDFGKPNERHIMLDLETLGTTAGSVILTVGAVVFDHTGVVARYYRRIDLESSLAQGFTVDAGTLQWWQMQGSDVRAEAFALTPTTPTDTVGSAMENISRFFSHGEKKVVLWGNGAAFDPVLLAGYFQKFALSLPFDYRNVRCYRTVSAMFPSVPRRTRDNAHNALADAEAQVARLLDIQAFLLATSPAVGHPKPPLHVAAEASTPRSAAHSNINFPPQ